MSRRTLVLLAAIVFALAAMLGWLWGADVVQTSQSGTPTSWQPASYQRQSVDEASLRFLASAAPWGHKNSESAKSLPVWQLLGTVSSGERWFALIRPVAEPGAKPERVTVGSNLRNGGQIRSISANQVVIDIDGSTQTLRLYVNNNASNP